MNHFHPTRIFGVDFSGAKLAGRNIWISEAAVMSDGRLQIASVFNLEAIAGTADREPALAYLVSLIGESSSALWGIDFPFGLPIELFDATHGWPDQLQAVQNWPDGANAFGLWCVAKARTLGDKMHIRRCTDSETKTPFDCYHYRIIYQTFHGMRDVLLPLTTQTGTAVWPFLSMKNPKRVVVESCPGSTLKRLGLPHQNYKQPTGGPLTAIRRRTRRAIIDGLAEHAEIPEGLQRLAMRNPGGDALDAILAAIGVHQAWRAMDAKAIAAHPRYGREGMVFA